MTRPYRPRKYMRNATITCTVRRSPKATMTPQHTMNLPRLPVVRLEPKASP